MYFNIFMHMGYRYLTTIHHNDFQWQLRGQGEACKKQETIKHEWMCLWTNCSCLCWVSVTYSDHTHNMETSKCIVSFFEVRKFREFCGCRSFMKLNLSNKTNYMVEPLQCLSDPFVKIKL